jgi:hypothetical protein
MTLSCGILWAGGIAAGFADSCIISQENLPAMHFLKGFLMKYYLEKSFTKIPCLTKRMISF